MKVRNGNRVTLSFVDVRKAYFNAECARDMYIQLSPEDSEEGIVWQATYVHV